MMNGLATYGKINAYIGLVVGILIAIGACIGAVYIRNSNKEKEKTLSQKVTAKVTKAACTVRSKKQWDCNLTVDFTTKENKNITQDIQTVSHKDLSVNSKINIVYNPSDPTQVMSEDAMNESVWLVRILFSAGSCILVAVIVNVVLSSLFPAYAAFSAVGSLVSR